MWRAVEKPHTQMKSFSSSLLQSFKIDRKQLDVGVFMLHIFQQYQSVFSHSLLWFAKTNLEQHIKLLNGSFLLHNAYPYLPISFYFFNTIHEVCKDLWLFAHMDRMTPPIGGDGIGLAFFVYSEMESPYPGNWASGEAVWSPSYSAKNLWLRNWYKRSGEITCTVQLWSLQESSIWGPVTSLPYKHEHKKHCMRHKCFSLGKLIKYYLTILFSTYWIDCNMMATKSFY